MKKFKKIKLVYDDGTPNIILDIIIPIVAVLVGVYVVIVFSALIEIVGWIL